MQKNSIIISLLSLWLIATPLWAATGEPIRHVKTSEKVVALTFDDGPDIPYTQQVLDVLKRNNVKATFYVLGGNARANPALIKTMMQEGHDIGSHSMYHDKMKRKSVAQIKKDLSSVDKILRDLGYNKEITFRAPYGITSPELKTALVQLDKRMVLFTFLAQDWEPISSEKIYNNVMQQLKPGLIITLHDGGKRRENTVKATDMLIKSIKEKGYKMVTVSELLTLDKPQ